MGIGEFQLGRLLDFELEAHLTVSPDSTQNKTSFSQKCKKVHFSLNEFKKKIFFFFLILNETSCISRRKI